MAERQYPFPSRTRKSSSPAPMILRMRESRSLPGFFLFFPSLWNLSCSIFTFREKLNKRYLKIELQRKRKPASEHHVWRAAAGNKPVRVMVCSAAGRLHKRGWHALTSLCWKEPARLSASQLKPHVWRYSCWRCMKSSDNDNVFYTTSSEYG